MTSPVLVELCAGSAAVSLRWLHPRAKPPIAYQGGKRAYADAILLAMGLRPGGGARSGRVVLVEAGPWGEAWAWWASGGIPDTVERLRAWATEDPRELWTRLAKAPVPTERGERVATWAVLAFWQFGCQATLIHDGRWHRREAGRWRTITPSNAWTEKEWRDRHGDVGIRPPLLLPLLISELESLPNLSRVTVIHGDVRDVEPIRGASVYLDPNYDGTNGYGHSLPRADVLDLARRWRAAECSATISEACALPLDGWHAHRLGKPNGRGRTWSKQQSEWLTMSAPPVGVLNFGDIA